MNLSLSEKNESGVMQSANEVVGEKLIIYSLFLFLFMLFNYLIFASFFFYSNNVCNVCAEIGVCNLMRKRGGGGFGVCKLTLWIYNFNIGAVDKFYLIKALLYDCLPYWKLINLYMY